MTSERIILLTVAMAASGLCTETRYIGTASCAGSFWVDSAGVSNHATIFENSTVETEGTAAKLQIAGGVRILLDACSRAQVAGDRLVLEKGRVQMDSGKDYRIEARSIRVSLGKEQARAIVSIGMPDVVEVAALGGMVHVANAEGVVVAHVAAGRAVDLRVGQTSEAAVLTGCVVKTGGGYTLRDEASAVTVELRGADVADQVGKRVHVTGAITPSQRALAPADQVIQAKAIQVLAPGCEAVKSAAVTGSRARTAPQPEGTESSIGSAGDPAPAGGGSAGGTAGSAVAASTAGTAGAAGGASAGIGVSTAVIAGVAVAAAAGTAAALVETQSHKPPISPGR